VNADLLDADAIGAALAGTVFAGRMHHFAMIGSTNTFALEEARAGAPHGSFYVADEQTAGRGRSDHRWHSAAGDGLYLSVLLRLEIAVSELPWIPLLAGLAAHRAIGEAAEVAADLRWPNDILIKGRKVAGILVEAPHAAGEVKPLVVGIGINIHQQSFPPDLATPATSLDLSTGRWNSRQRLLVALLQSLHVELAALEADRNAALAAIPARVEAVSSWVRGRAVEVHGPQACTGVTAGLDAGGFLLVRTATGMVTVTTGGIRDRRAIIASIGEQPCS
jgi:BirA family biotin operon repressor/biotin-[acetyl-CoA-carboxylase] ligase